MKICMPTAAMLLIAVALGASPAKACGFEEAPLECGLTPEGEARHILSRVIAGIEADEPRALQQIQHGESGFRTQDTYVFCIGLDGIMSANPNPTLQGHDVRQVHDQTGNDVFAAMMTTAEPGKVADIRYFVFPRGTNRAVPKTSYYTRVADQVCGVGVYDGDDTPAPSEPLAPQ